MTAATTSLALGFLGSLFFIASCSSVVRRRVLVLGLISSAILITSYFVKADFSTSFLVCVALTRNALYLVVGGSVAGRRLVWSGLSAVAIAGWLLTSSGASASTVIPLVGALLMLAAFGSGNMLTLKVATVLNGGLWLSYEWVSGAYTVMIGETVGLVFAAVAVARLASRRRNAPRM